MSVWDESPLPPPVPDAAIDPPPGGPPDLPPAPADDPADNPRPRRGLLLVLAAMALVVGVGVVIAFLPADDDTGDSEPAAPVATVATPASDTATTDLPAAGSPTTAPATATTPAAPATTTGTTEISTTTTSTATSTTSSTAPPTTTTAPSTTADSTTAPISEPTTITDDDGRRLTVTPRLDTCGGGPECLVVAFEIDGFASAPQTFVCEFASGNRYEFRFDSQSVTTACSTGDRPDSIVVEVDGLRSDPITISN